MHSRRSISRCSGTLAGCPVARGRPAKGRPEFWFCRSERCAFVGLCEDPLFCTQLEYAIYLGMKAQKNAATGRRNQQEASDAE